MVVKSNSQTNSLKKSSSASPKNSLKKTISKSKKSTSASPKNSLKNNKSPNKNNKSPNKPAPPNKNNKSPKNSPVNKWSPASQMIKQQNKDYQALFKNSILANTDESFKKEKKDYQDSFSNIITFSSKVSDTVKKSINCIIFNNGNADGIMSAYVATQFLTDNKKTDILCIPMKPLSGHGVDGRFKRHESDMKGRVILVVDLQYNKENLEYFKSLAKEVIIIDDHSIGQRITNKNNKGFAHFIGDEKHAAIGYTWKFFNPKDDVPLFVQLIDNDDRKLRLPFLTQFKSIMKFYQYRVFHNPYLSIRFDKLEDFKHLDVIVKNDMNNIMDMIGFYYDELANNIKTQVAVNARTEFFQGYKVKILNYDDPVLYKMVGRQIMTNAMKRGEQIDFVVLYGYQFSNRCYKVSLHEYESGKPPRYNLTQMAQTLGKKGGTAKGGGGSKYLGNFYWPHNKEMDIWDLFTKTKTFI